MGEFQRSPSKVWWADESAASLSSLSLSWRGAHSSSPGSQDSGFSDTETSPTNNCRPQQQQQQQQQQPQQAEAQQPQPSPRTPKKQPLPAALQKNAVTPKSNLTSEIVEKCTPDKTLRLDALITPSRVYYLPEEKSRSTPVRLARTEPVQRRRGGDHYRETLVKVSRNLFNAHTAATATGDGNQYAVRDAFDERAEQPSDDVHVDDIVNNEEDEEDDQFDEFDSADDISRNRTLPFASRPAEYYPLNLSAPAYIFQTATPASTEDDGGELDPCEEDSDSESEMETYFQSKSPQHTSTPKTCQKPEAAPRLSRMHAMNLLQKFQQQPKEHLKPRIDMRQMDERAANYFWLHEQRRHYEPECMTTLQCKSILSELNERVGRLAMKISATLRNLLRLHRNIDDMFDYYKNHKDERQEATAHLLPLIQEYLDALHTNEKRPNLQQLLLDASPAMTVTTINLSKLRKVYAELHTSTLSRHAEAFVEALAEPHDELDVRCKLTALITLAQRDTAAIDALVAHGAIQCVAAIVEKCEGSSVRGLGLRALTALCVRGDGVRRLARVGGVTTLADVVCDASRPEPERTEAVALLAQITAPWIDDNNNNNNNDDDDDDGMHHGGLVRTLHPHTRRLVKHLTRYAHAARCGQHVLLASAALAHLAAMDAKASKYAIAHDTVGALLDVVQRHAIAGGAMAAYILEQVATLIATMAGSPEAREPLCDVCAPVALLCFMQTRGAHGGDDGDDAVILRLRQRAVIALSRLCSLREAAEQVVAAGGVEKLVRLCKDKRERLNNDAILVAALATLRKITEACGAQVMNDEDAQELIQPKLLDSFKAYATQSESLV